MKILIQDTRLLTPPPRLKKQAKTKNRTQPKSILKELTINLQIQDQINQGFHCFRHLKLQFERFSLITVTVYYHYHMPSMHNTDTHTETDSYSDERPVTIPLKGKTTFSETFPHASTSLVPGK